MTDAPRTGIYPRQTLTEGEIAEIRVLADACLQRDELDLRLLWEVLQSRSGETANDFLHYVDGELVGFLTIDGVGDEDAEATGMVMAETYGRLGYQIVELPLVGIEQRADFVAENLRA